MPPNEEMLAAALERLKWATRSSRRADVALDAVEKIEAAAANCRLETNASVPVVLTTDGATFNGHFLVEAQLAVNEGVVVLARNRSGTDGKFVIGWRDLRVDVRDDVAHALPALADAVAALLLAWTKSLRAVAFKAEVPKVMAIGAERDGGSTDV